MHVLSRAGSLTVAVASVASVVGSVDPHQGGRYPACFFHAATGLDCPGCGSLRAAHDLLYGNVVAALDHNTLFVLFLPTALAAALRWIMGRAPLEFMRAPAVIPSVLAGLAVWTLVRNVWPSPLGAA